MTKATPAQSFQRLKTIPQSLQEALFSVHTAEIIKRIADENHIVAENVPALAKATGRVLLGFIHPEELGKELETALNLNSLAAKAISDALQSRLFGSLKDSLDKAYAPVPAEPIVEEIKSPKMSSGNDNVLLKIMGSEPAPVIIEKNFGGSSLDSLKPKGVPVQQSKAPVMPPAAPQKMPQPAMQNPTLSNMPPQPPKPKEPLILHEETEVRPAETTGFRLNISADQFGSKKAGPEIPQKPATLEIGDLNKPRVQPQQIGKTAPPDPKIVHYTTLRTPLESNNSGPVSLESMTATNLSKETKGPDFKKPDNFKIGLNLNFDEKPKPVSQNIPPQPPKPPAPPMNLPVTNKEKNPGVIDLGSL